MADTNYKKPVKISVVVNTYNAEKHLETVLKTIKDFDEIVICEKGLAVPQLQIAVPRKDSRKRSLPAQFSQPVALQGASSGNCANAYE